MVTFKQNDLITGTIGEEKGYFLLCDEKDGKPRNLISIDNGEYYSSISNEFLHILDGVSDHRTMNDIAVNSMTKYLSEKYAVEDIYYLLSLYYKENGLKQFVKKDNDNFKWYFVFNTPNEDIKIYIEEQGDYMVAGYKTSLFSKKQDEVQLYKWLSNIIEYIISNVRSNMGLKIGNDIIVMSSLDKDTQERIEKITSRINESIYGPYQTRTSTGI